MFNKLFPKGSQLRTKVQNWYHRVHVSKHLAEKFIELDTQKVDLLKKSLVKNVYANSLSLDSPEVLKDIQALAVRFHNHRTQIIPWLNSIKALKGLKVLEIGCGNGTSTVALAEQGAIVTAVDIEEGLLADAKERCGIFGVQATFHLMNATEVSTSLAEEHFDMILFYAVLEHMTYAERINAISQTYAMLRPGGLWGVIGTPNRLHYYDSHTAIMPFFFWLPDELAIKYASLSPRLEFAQSFKDQDLSSVDKQIEFARWGRGMSYHEFELALGPLSKLTIVSSLVGFYKKRDLFYRLLYRYSENGRYKTFFSKLFPAINGGFFDPFLDLVIRK